MIRSFLFNIIFWPAFGSLLTVMYPIVYFSSQKTAFRLAYRPGSKFLIICLKYIAGIKCEFKNLDILKKALEKSPVIIGCNHQSAWETFVFSILFDDISIVVKKELFSVPIAGLYFKKLECIPVDRSTPIQAIKSLLKFGKIAFQKKHSILIFPNGTRESTDEKTEYKSGVFALYKSLEIPVLPAHLNSGKCWPRRSFKKIKGTITLDFKNPIAPGLTKEEFFKTFEERMNQE